MKILTNPFKYSDTNLRYHSFSYYLKERYQSKVLKISLDGGFTCPNRDGTKGFGGCSFCGSQGSGDFTLNKDKKPFVQYEKAKNNLFKKWPHVKTIPYFQAYTSTYGPLSKIKEMVKPFISLKEVVAIDIATRPDCLEDDVIAYLNSLTKVKDIWIELGLQTVHDKSAQSFNRGYSYQTFLNTIEKLSKTNIKVCVHLINGLINESEEMMINSAKLVSALAIDALKIHMLYVLKDSKLGQAYLKSNFKVLSKEEYVSITASQLEFVPAQIVIKRLTGDGPKDKLLAPKWSLNKIVVLNDIQKELVKRNSWQGKLLK